MSTQCPTRYLSIYLSIYHHRGAHKKPRVKLQQVDNDLALHEEMYGGRVCYMYSVHTCPKEFYPILMSHEYSFPEHGCLPSPLSWLCN
jgi:hypothetical protein